MNISKYLATALMTVMLMIVGITPANAATTLGAGVTQEVIFSDPYNAVSGYDYRIQARQIKMMDEAPVGAIVRFSAWRIQNAAFADAVVRSHRRGVKVFAVINGNHGGGPAYDKVKAALGARAVVCSTDHRYSTLNINSCLSTHAGSYMHSKIFLVTKTGTKSNVVMTTSANPTNHGNEANDALITSGDAGLHGAYVRYFDDMWNQRKNDNYMSSTNGSYTSASSRTFSQFTPKSDSNGKTSNQASTDNVAIALSKKAGGAGCVVKAHHRFWNATRSVVTDQVIRLRKAGCTVRVLSDDLSYAEKKRMEAVGIQVRRTIRQKDGHTVKTHHKYIVLKGTYNGRAGNHQVLTGSENLVRSSLRTADDVFIQSSHTPVVSAYEANFDKIWNHSRS